MSVAAHQLGARGALVVVTGFRIDTVLHEVNPPLLSGIHQGVLIQLSLAPFEALGSVRIAQKSEVGSRGGSRGAGGAQCRIGVRGSMAVNTCDLDRLSHL